MRSSKAPDDGPPDRVPLVLPGFEFASRSDLDPLTDPRHRRLAERVFEHVPFRVLVPSRVNRMLVTPPGRIHERQETLPNGRTRVLGTIDTPLGELRYVNERDPVSQTGWHAEYPVKDRSDIEKIASVPWTPPDASPLPAVDDVAAGSEGAAATDSEAFRRRGILETRISSPFVCVAGMMKFEMFLELCATDLSLIEELTDICRRRVLDFLTAVLRRPDIDCVWIGGSEWLTPPMASPKLYDALVQDQERELIKTVHARSDAVVHIHCHGQVREALPKMIERGGDYTEPVEPPPDGDLTMAEAKERAAGRITLGGNVECRILANGTEAEVEAAVRAAFEGGRGRFVLRPTERPSRLDERELRNLTGLIDVWEELSPGPDA
jgi:hypothetical protein